MFNGYDRDRMTRERPFAGIPVYLNSSGGDVLTIPGAKVTDICCVGDGGFTAEHVAQCSLIPNVVAKPTDVIYVDAVIIATDIGGEHVAARGRSSRRGCWSSSTSRSSTTPPTSACSPMGGRRQGDHVVELHAVHEEFCPTGSRRTSSARSASRASPPRRPGNRTASTCARGHLPELRAGFLSARNTGTAGRNVVHLKHAAAPT